MKKVVISFACARIGGIIKYGDYFWDFNDAWVKKKKKKAENREIYNSVQISKNGVVQNVERRISLASLTRLFVNAIQFNVAGGFSVMIT